MTPCPSSSLREFLLDLWMLPPSAVTGSQIKDADGPLMKTSPFYDPSKQLKLLTTNHGHS